MSKESFKIFARNHPELVSHVMSGDTTWQRLYELYDIYGDDNNIWSKYITNKAVENASSFKEVFNNLKNMDMNSLQKGVENLQKTIGMLQEFPLGKGNKLTDKPYIPREVYHHMED